MLRAPFDEQQVKMQHTIRLFTARSLLLPGITPDLYRSSNGAFNIQVLYYTMVLTSSERVHKWWLRESTGYGGRAVLLGLANLGVALGKLKPDCLG